MKECNSFKKAGHCCQLMNKFLDDPRVKIYYDKKTREYYLLTSSGAGQLMDYCPFCGEKLPEQLSDIWEKILKKEFKIKNPHDDDYIKFIPEEFLTDAWWKKRKL